jgi:alginate O-acetyltransferase complex protein AlgJ
VSRAQAFVMVFLGVAGCAVETPGDLADALRKELGALAAQAEQRGTLTIRGRDGWLFFGPELRHVSLGRFWGPDAARVSRARQPDRADPLPAILDFQRQLHDAGVELLLVPVPPKSIVHADMLPSSVSLPTPPPRLDPAHQSFYDRLRSEGVTVVDLTDFFLDNRSHPEGALYCRQDTHWSGTGCVLAAQAIAKLIRERPWLAEIPKQDFRAEWYSTPIQGDLWRDLKDDGLAREELRLRRIFRDAGGEPAWIESDPDSPIVLLGDSHVLVFQGGDDMHATGSGLAAQLALELGFAVELVGVRGSGATPARVNVLRRAQRNPDYWNGKRLVIWCFSAREFTESDGWSLVPITG